MKSVQVFLARGGFHGRGAGNGRNVCTRNHCILLFPSVNLSVRLFSRESSPVHPIDGFVWQYNVEPARATSEALDASQSASQPTEPPGPQFPVDKKRYPRVRSASPGYQQADREVDGAPECCRRQAVDTRVTRIPGTRLRWESVHEKHKAIFPPSRTAYAKGGMIYTTTCITSGSGSLLMQIPYLPIYCI